MAELTGTSMVIDVHSHIGQVRPSPDMRLDDADLIRKMDAWGIDHACVLALTERSSPNYSDAETADVIAACRRHPNRLTPFCVIDPRAVAQHSEADIRRWLEDYVEQGCRGFGEFVPDLPFDDPSCLALYQLAGALELPVLFDLHNTPNEYGLRDDPGLPRLEHALRECPETIFIGHGPTFWAEVSSDVTESQREGYPFPAGKVIPGGAVPRLLESYANLYAEISAGSGLNALTRDTVFGLEFLRNYQDKLLFGTDSCLRFDAQPVNPNREFMRRLRRERLLNKEACTKIESTNAVRLFGTAAFEKIGR